MGVKIINRDEQEAWVAFASSALGLGLGASQAADLADQLFGELCDRMFDAEACEDTGDPVQGFDPA